MIDNISKKQEALRILLSCLSPGNGIFASPDRYQYQCWTRDLSLAVAPLLLELGNSEIVKTHLRNLSQRQRPNGQIPILFLSDEQEWRKKKIDERFAHNFL